MAIELLMSKPKSSGKEENRKQKEETGEEERKTFNVKIYHSTL